MASWRLELFFKNSSDLRLKTIPFLQTHQHKFRGVNLTSKNKDDDLLESVSILQQELPNLDICVHYSIKYNYHHSPTQTLTSLTTFLETLEAQTLKKGGGRCSVLLVSGSGKRKGMDSLSALENFSTSSRPAAARAIPLYVAFNPYLPTPEELKIEYDGLHSKLMAEPRRIAGVYLQMGTDIAALEAGLDYLEKIAADATLTAAAGFDVVGSGSEGAGRGGKGTGNPRKLEIYGSVFIPSKRLLAQMKYRPWNGVFLSEKYLAGVETANEITASILDIYKKRGVVPLVETSIKTDEELKHCITLLNSNTN